MLKNCVLEAVSVDGNNCGITRTVTWESTVFLCKMIVSDTEAGSVTMPYECPHDSLVQIADFIWWVTVEHGKRSKRKRSCTWRCAACGEQYDWRAANKVLTIHEQTASLKTPESSKLRSVGMSDNFGAPAASSMWHQRGQQEEDGWR